VTKALEGFDGKGNPRLALSALREVREYLALIGKWTGEFTDSPQVAIQTNVLVQSGASEILEAVGELECPECHARVDGRAALRTKLISQYRASK
jgi:hypothetical protein